MEELKLINSLYACCSLNSDTAVRTIIEKEDLEDACQKIVDGFFDNMATVDDLKRIINILNYLEEEMAISSPVSDTMYDMILEILNDANFMTVGIDNGMGTEEGAREHKYPELRGSLKKVHYAITAEIPEKDSRKSLEDFLSGALSPFYTDIASAHDPEDVGNDIFIYTDYKWDGLSNVFECCENKIDHVLTRYKVKLNLGKDITHIYKGRSVSNVFGLNIPYELLGNTSYGIKTEIIMPQEQFEAYKKYTMNSKCNRRSAVSSILNRTADNFDPELLKFLRVIPLQISTEQPILALTDESTDGLICGEFAWLGAGTCNGRYQYISIYTPYCANRSCTPRIFSCDCFSGDLYLECFEDLASELYDKRDSIEAMAEKEGIPIDGMVFTLINDELIDKLGRSNDRNNFQVAFKFPAGTAKTTLLDVDFQVGPIAGSITPVAIIEPVWINGNKISHIGLSNMEKMERLNLHIGDEIIVQYDIIPKIIIDDTCKKGTGDKIVAIENCPVCGGDIKSGRCTNPDCDAKLVGRISNYVSKMNIAGFGIETVSALVSRDILTSVVDLYKLSQRKAELLEIQGFQEKTVSNLIAAPLNRLHIYPHELLGSIGIPDVSLTTMEKICRVIELDVLVNTPEVLLSMYRSIRGVGEIIAGKIVEGVSQKADIIKGLIPYFTFKPYKTLTGNVVFTGIRDGAFSEFLRDNPGIGTSSSVTKDTIAVITKDDPDSETSSMKDAKERDIPILAITEAKNKWGYQNTMKG